MALSIQTEISGDVLSSAATVALCTATNVLFCAKES